MSHEFLPLHAAAAHVHVAANELKHVAQRGEIDAQIRSGEWYFEHAALDEWAQRHLLASNPKSLREQHRLMVDERRRAREKGGWVADLLAVAAIDLAIPAKAKGGLIRDMTTLAERSGFVYDPETLFKELVAREEAASTAVGAGAAFLHPRYHDPYFFEQSFIAYGRVARPIFFGAPEGAATRHFFLICSTNDDEHLHILARLAMMTSGTDLLAQLDAAETVAHVLEAIRTCEEPYAK
ncbi:MAG: PTS sugar transporter subunit IIA [Kiritimatiellia bacterium]